MRDKHPSRKFNIKKKLNARICNDKAEKPAQPVQFKQDNNHHHQLALHRTSTHFHGKV